MPDVFIHPRSGLEIKPKFGSAALTAIEVATGKAPSELFAAAQDPSKQLAAFVTFFWSSFAHYGEHAPNLAEIHQLIDADQQRAVDAMGRALSEFAERMKPHPKRRK